MLFRLSAEEKVIGVGGLVAILSVFMPWYSVVLSFEKGITESGFSGDLGVVGFVVFLFTLLSLGFLMGDHLHFRIPRFGFKKEGIILFFSGESAFLLLLEAAIFTKRSLDYTNAEIRFGLYLALIGSLFATFAAYAQLQKLGKNETKAFFEHDSAPEEPVEPQAEEPALEETVEKPPHAKRHHVVKKEEGKLVIQERFFEEEKPLQPTEELLEPEISDEETIAETLSAAEESPAENQGNYFLRDADVSVTLSPKKPEKTEEPAPTQPNRLSAHDAVRTAASEHVRALPEPGIVRCVQAGAYARRRLPTQGRRYPQHQRRAQGC